MGNSEPSTLLTVNTRTGVKKNASTSYSSYWMDFDDVGHDICVTDNISDTERIMKLASVRRSIANFVRILTNDEKINVTFSSGNQSYTDGKRVVISATDDPKKFDTMVGLALHEASHCLLSDFNFLQAVLPAGQRNEFYMSLSDKLRNTLTNHSKSPSDGMTVMPDVISAHNGVERVHVSGYQKLLGMIMNIIEDRRIDSYMYKHALGYRPYYNSMYNQYFFNKDIDKNLKHNPEWRKPTVENYINWLINMFNPVFDRSALPGLGEMVDMIDLPNIRRFDADSRMPASFAEWPMAVISPKGTYLSKLDYSKLPMLWQTANDVLYRMLQYVAADSMKNLQSDEAENTNGVSVYIDEDTLATIPTQELNNLDMDATECSVINNNKFNANKGKRAIENMKKTMNGDVRKKKLKNREKTVIDQLESANAKLVDAGDKILGRVPCLVTRNITKATLSADWFPFARMEYGVTELYQPNAHKDAVARGIRMGQVLVHRLQIRNEPVVTQFTRQEHGKIDRRILAQLGMNIEQVFKRTAIENYKPAMLHLSLDASGSMMGDKWERTISVATAIAYLSSKIRNIDAVITLRGTTEIPVVSIVYDSRVDNFSKVRAIFPCLFAGGSTPEGLCFKATLDMITECVPTHDVYFINFSDGEPGCSFRRAGEHVHYGRDNALIQTKQQIVTMREAGVKVLSYFIDSGDPYAKTNQPSSSWNYGARNSFRKMYGEDAVFVNVDNVNEVLRTLNVLLLKKAA